jgi:hypothetical protein
MTNIFKFWRAVGPNTLVHPADEGVLARFKHGFDLKCLPSCVWGRLRTAPVVLLYLSPGLSKKDRAFARSSENRKYFIRKRDGRAPLARRDEESDGIRWVKSRTQFLGCDWDEINNRVAILNVGAYHSRSVADAATLIALPSCRITLNWAQTFLFPEAIAGRRVVICMRAARLWGLCPGRVYGKGLFVPAVTRGGHMKHGTMRRRLEKVARAAIRRQT